MRRWAFELRQHFIGEVVLLELRRRRTVTEGGTEARRQIAESQVGTAA